MSLCTHKEVCGTDVRDFPQEGKHERKWTKWEQVTYQKKRKREKKEKGKKRPAV